MRTPTGTRGVRRLALGAALAGALLLPGVAASAHVHVHPDDTTSGAYSQLSFRVPNESSAASTVKLQIRLPQNAPFLSVRTRSLPGWTAIVEQAELPEPVQNGELTITKAPRTVTWTADAGAEIGPGQYQEFAMSVGPLPKPGTVLLPAIQTYSDGKVVAWDQPTPASGEEPEHPAPQLTVTADEGSVVQGTTADAMAPVAASTTATRLPDSPARRLAAGAFLLALLAAACAVVAMRTQPRGLASARSLLLR